MSVSSARAKTCVVSASAEVLAAKTRGSVLAMRRRSYRRSSKLTLRKSATAIACSACLGLASCGQARRSLVRSSGVNPASAQVASAAASSATNASASPGNEGAADAAFLNPPPAGRPEERPEEEACCLRWLAMRSTMAAACEAWTPNASERRPTAADSNVTPPEEAFATMLAPPPPLLNE
eukprot:CAMPEP_0172596354 /NCGR_PEP_ID=MMETSP1068-20121228/16124_1 /TAXON_ID=35684 /ORGANISM="Pseudopedinella elastica, Strain CCMP716" /LENGTH=179 /DNA_ID=CAMNT_0013395331 /DNA_START=286 /DNA_END=825 /DNA_ORIENTATION=+